MALENRRLRVPFIGKLRQARRGFRWHGALASQSEVNPLSALRAPAGKPRVVPPRLHQRVMNRSPVVLKTKTNRLNVESAPWMRTIRIRVDDVRRHEPLLSSAPIQFMHRASVARDGYARKRVVRHEPNPGWTNSLLVISHPNGTAESKRLIELGSPRCSLAAGPLPRERAGERPDVRTFTPAPSRPAWRSGWAVAGRKPASRGKCSIAS